MCTTEPIDILWQRRRRRKKIIAEKRFKRFHEFDFVHFPSLATTANRCRYRVHRRCRRCMMIIFSQSSLKNEVKTSFHKKSVKKNWRIAKKSWERNKKHNANVAMNEKVARKIDNRYVCCYCCCTLYNFIDEKSTNHEKERTSSQNGNNNSSNRRRSKRKNKRYSANTHSEHARSHRHTFHSRTFIHDLYKSDKCHKKRFKYRWKEIENTVSYSTSTLTHSQTPTQTHQN